MSKTGLNMNYGRSWRTPSSRAEEIVQAAGKTMPLTM
jgi:hypothetical protein